jgi:hypothetical protein
MKSSNFQIRSGGSDSYIGWTKGILAFVDLGLS